jgi:hypothetical protein
MEKNRPEISLAQLGRRQGFRTSSRTLLSRMGAFGRKDSGSVAIITGILMVVLLGFLALVVDIGHLAVVRNEVQNAADAAALAGARALLPLPGTSAPPYAMQDPPPCFDIARPAAMATSAENKANLEPVNIDSNEVIFGHWDFDTKTFTQTNCESSADGGLSTNAVKVIVGASPKVSVAMSFARIFGINTKDASATAIAATGCLGTVARGWLASNLDYLKAIRDYYSDFWARYDELYADDPNPPDPNDYFQTNTSSSLLPEGPYCYFVLQPAKGPDEDWTLADNAGWSLPDGVKPFTSNIKKLIQGDNVSINNVQGGTVDLNNGEIASIIKTIQDTYASDPSLLENLIVSGVETNSYNQPATAEGFFSITITGAWKAGDPLPSEFIENNPLIDPTKVVGLIQFYMLPEMVYGGDVGKCAGANTKSLEAVLVQ